MTAPAIDGGSVPDVPRTGLLGLVQGGVNVLNNVLAVGAALATAAAGLVLTWEVIGRYFLGIASDWQDELSVFLLQVLSSRHQPAQPAHLARL